MTKRGQSEKSLANLKANAGRGRLKGTPNKATASMKAAIQTVYAKLQDGRGGDHAHFLKWAEGEPGEFYKLAAKLLPIQLSGDEDNPVRHIVRVELVGGDR